MARRPLVAFMARGDEGPDVGGILGLALGGIAWASFLVAFFVASDPFFYLIFAMACGAAGIVLAWRARQNEAAAVAMGGAAAGAALLYGVTLLAALTAMVYAMGVLMFLMLVFILAVMFTGQPPCRSSAPSSPPPDPCCCDDCCGDCNGACADCCSCGSCCDCGCGDCGCSGCDCGCGGCGCATLGLSSGAMLARAPLWPGLRELLARGIPHHPDLPEYRADVFVVRGARWCIGCFTTYPLFLAASAALVVWTPGWTSALGLGASLAAAQAISSAGLARWRASKVVVKACLGVGLALVVSGIHSAPWPPAAKVGALLGVLALAALSALPRARRMQKARAARCANHHEGRGCGAATSASR